MIVVKRNNKIADDWQREFPLLKVYDQNKFYRIVGCVVIGIELVKIPRTDNYRPHFVLYSLCKDNIKECMDIPIVLQQFYDKKNFQLDIPFDANSNLFKEAVEIIKRQYPILISDKVLIKDIISAIDNYSSTKRFSIAPNSYFQGEFMQMKLEIELFAGNTKKVQEILNVIGKRDWDVKHFTVYGVDVKGWIANLQEEINKQDFFIQKVENNLSDKKLAKLKISLLHS
ncbi:hypothetical protein D3C87_1184230 [compost metagenome]